MNIADTGVDKPMFNSEKALELLRLIVRMSDSRDTWYRLIWIEGNDLIAKESFSEYLVCLVNSKYSDIALKNVEQIFRDKDKEDYQEFLFLLNNSPIDLNCIRLLSLKKETLTELERKENTLFVFNEVQYESKLKVSEDFSLLEFIQGLSAHNNWFLWVSGRPKDDWHPDEDDMRAIKIRDHESFAIVRLNKTKLSYDK